MTPGAAYSTGARFEVIATASKRSTLIPRRSGTTKVDWGIRWRSAAVNVSPGNGVHSRMTVRSSVSTRLIVPGTWASPTPTGQDEARSMHATKPSPNFPLTDANSLTTILSAYSISS